MRTRLCLLLVLSIWFLSHTALAYEICTPQNDYLESALPNWTNPAALNPTLPPACVEAAQRSLAVAGYYGYCADDNGKPGRTNLRPCISRNYIGSVYNALVDVSECVGVDAKRAFSVFNLESALHLNAVGAATDIGVGQLTSSAINEVNLNVLPAAIRAAKRSSLASCRRVLPAMFLAETDINKRCSFISVPKNPDHNMVFAVLLLKRNRQIVDNYVIKLGLQFPQRVNGPRVKELVGMLAYNSGAGGVMAVLKTYIDLWGEQLTDAQFDFENRGPGSFVSFLQKNFPINDDTTRKRVSKYIGYIIQSARRVESGLTEGLCSDQDLFHTPVYTNGPTTEPHAVKVETIAALVDSNLRKLSAREPERMTLSADDCAQRKAEYLYTFVPRGSTLHDMPAVVQTGFTDLCGSR